MTEQDFRFVIPERRQGMAALGETSGPDIDAILRDAVTRFMKLNERNPTSVAHALGIPLAEFEDWLGGSPGKIDLLSSAIAVLGVRDVDSLLSTHDGYDRKSRTTVTLKEVLVAKVAQMVSTEHLRIAIELRFLLAEVPEAIEFLRCGIINAYDYADHQGIDVSAQQQRLERTLSRIWRPTAVNG
jgi:hypothetical protein